MSLYLRNPFDSGGKGGVLFTSTTARNGNFYAIQILTATVFNTSGTVGNLTGDALTGVSFPAGTVIYGGWTSIQLVSGSAIAYTT